MKVLIIENSFDDLRKSRFPLGDYFQESGLDVCYACPGPLDKEVFNIPMSRNKLDVFKLVEGYFTLIRIETHTASEAVISFRFIPNVLNYLASFKNKHNKRIGVITGLGYAYVSTNSSYNSKVQRLLIKIFYRLASRRMQIVAQNFDDLKELGVANGVVILGSGINEEIVTRPTEFYFSSIRLLYVGRLLKSKGFLTVIDIFEQLLSYHQETTLTIAGTIDPYNPDSIDEFELDQIKAKEGVNYLGYVHDIDNIYPGCNVFLFPSIYREGVPRVVIDALKYGLTIVTSDMPGCKETIENNGFLLTRNNSLQDIVDYLRDLNEEEFLKNHSKSTGLFKNVFCAKVIYPKYLELLR